MMLMRMLAALNVSSTVEVHLAAAVVVITAGAGAEAVAVAAAAIAAAAVAEVLAGVGCTRTSVMIGPRLTIKLHAEITTRTVMVIHLVILRVQAARTMVAIHRVKVQILFLKVCAKTTKTKEKKREKFKYDIAWY